MKNFILNLHKVFFLCYYGYFRFVALAPFEGQYCPHFCTVHGRFSSKFGLTRLNFQFYRNLGTPLIYPVVRLSLTAVDLPNLETVGISDPFYEVWGYDLLGADTLLYTSEVVPNEVEFVKWKPAVFAVSKSTIFNKI